MASFEKRGNKYRAVVSYTDSKGVHRKTSKTFPTKKLATMWASETETKINGGLDINAGKITFPEYYKQWVETYKVGTIREATLKSYTVYEHNIEVMFAGMKLSDLTTGMIQRKLNEFSTTHRHSYMHTFVSSIKSSLKDAHLDGLIDHDIYSRLKSLGDKSLKQDNFLSVAEFEKLRSYLYNHVDDMPTNPFLLMALIALETGARVGEILSLTITDIHNDSISINKSYSMNVGKVTSTKNISSMRDVSITTDLSSVLGQYINTLTTNELFEKKPHSADVADYIRRLIKNADVHTIGFHGLRHSHVSYLLHNGVDIQYISKRVGHKNVGVTLSTYAHMLKEKELAQDELALNILSKK